ncbi:hypothetical protein H206_06242 [Candidatus Electrothrix aarhusensis]|uniref:Uncharacterized protein n=1 Tax=Candidatus Electrothrix aarhusensis TaxID=1859131 RepID=A0A444J3K3_9BACT|nr:hypothetical protein H206_06242 [Candidatus Electrothrix aarhusensis]
MRNYKLHSRPLNSAEEGQLFIGFSCPLLRWGIYYPLYLCRQR